MDNRPLSPGEYFGLQILYSLPLIGFIFLIVHSVSSTNINRRNFARSYWCVYVLVAIVLLVLLVTGVGAALLGGVSGSSAGGVAV